MWEMVRYIVILSVTDQEYWYEQARIALRRRLQYVTDRRPHAKNVVLFVGDGMGVATATAARILRGQRLGKRGEDHELAWDTFPAVAFAKVCTYKDKIYSLFTINKLANLHVSTHNFRLFSFVRRVIILYLY